MKIAAAIALSLLTFPYLVFSMQPFAQLTSTQTNRIEELASNYGTLITQDLTLHRSKTLIDACMDEVVYNNTPTDFSGIKYL